MPQLIALALTGAAVIVGARWIARTAAAAMAEAERQRAEAEREALRRREPRDLGALEFDVTSGVYRPRRPT